jgi:hypothetical protein
MKKEKGSKRNSSADSYLQLDAIFDARDRKVFAFFERAREEEFAKFFNWLRLHSSADGCVLLVPDNEAVREFQRAMDRVHARVGYRFMHLLSPLMQQRLREVFPPPPPFPQGGHPALNVAV